MTDPASTRPTVLLVADIEGWAFDNIARNIVANLSDQYAFTIVYMGGYTGRPAEFIAEHFLDAAFDHVHFFWRDDVRVLTWPEHLHLAASASECSVEDVVAAMCRPVLTTSVYDHLNLDAEKLAERVDSFAFTDGYTVSSKILRDIYEKLPQIPPPDAVITDGVRLDMFEKADRTENGPLTIGWVGNSKWGTHSHDDPKGLHSILRPAIAQLRAEGLDLVEHFADLQQRKRTRDEMVAYYQQIDVLVCASLIEGTPNPVLEAMAAGVAVVSTDVGIVREALGDKQRAMILPERTVAAMADALRQLAQDRQLLKELADENLASVQSWDWGTRTQGWPVFWNDARRRHEDWRHAYARRKALSDACRRLSPAQPEEEAIAPWRPSLPQRLRAIAGRTLYRYPKLAQIVNKARGR